jgi:DNA-binding transcriptional regulator YiaG
MTTIIVKSGYYEFPDDPDLGKVNTKDMYTMRMKWLQSGRTLESYHSTFYTMEYQESLTPTAEQVKAVRIQRDIGIQKMSRLLHLGTETYRDVERGKLAMPYQIFELMCLKQSHRGFRKKYGPSGSWMKTVRCGLGLDAYQCGAMVYSTADQWISWERSYGDMPVHWYELFQLKAGLVV